MYMKKSRFTQWSSNNHYNTYCVDVIIDHIMCSCMCNTDQNQQISQHETLLGTKTPDRNMKVSATVQQWTYGGRE